MLVTLVVAPSHSQLGFCFSQFCEAGGLTIISRGLSQICSKSKSKGGFSWSFITFAPLIQKLE